MFKLKYKKFMILTLLAPAIVLSAFFSTLFIAPAAPVYAQTPEYRSDDCRTVDRDNCGIVGYLVIFINVLSAIAGVVIAGSIAYGGIQYSMSGSDPQKVSAAKSRIRNALIALLLFIFGYGFLNFLVPGGLI